MRKKKTNIQKLRDKCDALLTPIIKLSKPRCEGCGAPTQVAHHWKEKSISAFLRYDLRNLIALCHICHSKIHNRFGNSVSGAYDIADKIVQDRGREWKDEMDQLARKVIKTDKAFYESNLERLNSLLEALD